MNEWDKTILHWFKCELCENLHDSQKRVFWDDGGRKGDLNYWSILEFLWKCDHLSVKERYLEILESKNVLRLVCPRLNHDREERSWEVGDPL